jgi:hypothetical protein
VHCNKKSFELSFQIFFMEILCFVYVKSGSKYTANLLFFFYIDIFFPLTNMSNTACVFLETGTDYPSRAPEFMPRILVSLRSVSSATCCTCHCKDIFHDLIVRDCHVCRKIVIVRMEFFRMNSISALQ